MKKRVLLLVFLFLVSVKVIAQPQDGMWLAGSDYAVGFVTTDLTVRISDYFFEPGTASSFFVPLCVGAIGAWLWSFDHRGNPDTDRAARNMGGVLARSVLQLRFKF